MAKNIRFHYLYRDSGNYKKFGHKDFSNPDQLPVEQVRLELEQRLIDRSFFYPEVVGIKKFRFHRFCEDYSWYEMENVEEVNFGKCKESIIEFIKRLENADPSF